MARCGLASCGFEGASKVEQDGRRKDIKMTIHKRFGVGFVLSASLAMPAAMFGQQTTVPPATSQTTTTTTATPMNKDEMKAQKKQQKSQEKAAKENAKAAKEQSKAVKHQDKATDSAEKAAATSAAKPQ
jgi:outer membrane biosynthesis protein TonB